jgi:hypothetical protein
MSKLDLKKAGRELFSAPAGRFVPVDLARGDHVRGRL